MHVTKNVARILGRLSVTKNGVYFQKCQQSFQQYWLLKLLPNVHTIRVTNEKQNQQKY